MTCRSPALALCAAIAAVFASADAGFAQRTSSADRLTRADLDTLLAVREDASRRADRSFSAGPAARSYPFPGRREDLEDGVYWHVTGHANGHKRDLSATRFDAATGRWTRSRPAGFDPDGDVRSLIWDMPVYAPASGIILTCWRNVLDGDDPGDDGCGDDPAPGAACVTPASGNHVAIWVPEERRLIQMMHFRRGSVPEHLCPHKDTYVENWKDKSGAFGFNPDILVPFPWPRVEEGELVGRVGNSGKSGGDHLHMQIRDCSDETERLAKCPIVPTRFHGASVAQKTRGRDIREDEWQALNGPLSVTSPKQAVLPTGPRDEFQPEIPDRLSLEQDGSGFAQVVLDVSNPEAPVDRFDWEVEPTGGVFEEQLRMTWRLDASCRSGVESLRLDSPAGTQTQTFPEGRTAVSGDFTVESVSADELRRYCLDWAEAQSASPACRQAPELCRHTADFDLTGGRDPGVSESVLEIGLRCRSGHETALTAEPSLLLRCGALPFGFPR